MRKITNNKGIDTLIFAETFEYEAYDQIKKLVNFEAYENSKVRIMPDAHAGKGCTVGTTMTITDKVSPLIKGGILFFLLLLIDVVQPFTLERVDAGHVGIKVNLTGDSRGISSFEYKTGWVVVNTWVSKLYEFPTFQQHIDYPEQQVISKGGFAATIKPSFNGLRLCVCLPLAQCFNLPQMLMGQIAQNRCYTLARLIKR